MHDCYITFNGMENQPIPSVCVTAGLGQLSSIFSSGDVTISQICPDGFRLCSMQLRIKPAEDSTLATSEPSVTGVMMECCKVEIDPATNPRTTYEEPSKV